MTEAAARAKGNRPANGESCGPLSNESGSTLPLVGLPETFADSVTVEVVAARQLLANHSPSEVRVDSAFAKAGVAPGIRTDRIRPSARNVLLADSLNSRLSRDQPVRKTVLMLSEPEFVGDSARVTVTISYDTGRLPHGQFYETVLFVLRRIDAVWRVTRSTQLGIS